MPLAELFEVGAATDYFNAHRWIGTACFRTLIEHRAMVAETVMGMMCDSVDQTGNLMNLQITDL